MIDSNSAWIDLPDEGVLAVRGADARKFLNGQLSQQLLTLGPTEATLAGLHTPQGRTVAILRVAADGPQDLLCVLPRSLLEGVLALLRKYLLRSKAALSDETPLWRVQGRWPAAGAVAEANTTEAAAEAATPLGWPHTRDGRWMRLAPVDSTASQLDSPPSSEIAAWHRADIAAGLPRIHPATQGEFVAQMLNLDVLGGISFNKGCYTGQEVIARAHFRGRVKRRLQRFAAPAEAIDNATFLPGAKVMLADGREAVLVDRAEAHEGQVEFLAVTHYPVATSNDASAPRLASTALPLPYELPADE
ncbi:MAG: folate-binding protein YgfZ [Sinobacteraceae bacterium]|nr:folate-binding protein YgfZ [Nevskiaceae bacterium]